MMMSAGYEAEPVEGSPMKQGLRCLHCDLLLRNPVQTEDGQRVCKPCFLQIQSFPDGTCSKCGVSSTETCYPDRAVQREVFSLLVYCAYKKHGCQWQGSLKGWESHCSQCEFKGILCPNEGCLVETMASEMERHLRECQFRCVSCSHCSTNLPFHHLETHYSKCEEFEVTCDEEICAATFKRKNMLEHNSHQCKVMTCITCSTKVIRATGEEIASASLTNTSSSPSPADGGGHQQITTISLTTAASVRGLSTTPTHHASSAPQLGGASEPDSSLRLHLADPLQSFQHHQQLAGQVRELEVGVASLVKTQEAVSEVSKQEMKLVRQLKEENTQLKSQLSQLKSSFNELVNTVKSLTTQLATTTTVGGKSTPSDHTHPEKLEALVRADAKKTSSEVRSLKKEVAELQRELGGLRERGGGGGGGGRVGTVGVMHADGPSPSPSSFSPLTRESLKAGYTERKDAASVRTAHGHGATVGQGGGEVLDVVSESRLTAAERRQEEMSKQLALVKAHGQELELQLQASLASTHNGTFLWRIPEVSRRRRDAIQERVTSIYSPPFYTSRNGYKMCIRAYLNGDGMGYKTHLSLFFVLMRGECDPLLKWPFEHKVSMILVDQTHRKHVVQTFKPTPESSSFHQPVTEMNVASGCPQFAKLTVFDDDSYIKNDVMFIKCIVDTSKIFHP